MRASSNRQSRKFVTRAWMPFACRPCGLAAAVLVSVGCASSDARFAEAEPAAVDLETPEIAGVVELEPEPTYAANSGLRCEQEHVIGSRIPRTRCYRPLNEAEQQLNADMARSELELSRELVLLEEQMRLERATAPSDPFQ